MEYFRTVKNAMKENQFDGWIGREPNIMTAAGNSNQGIDQYKGDSAGVDNLYLLAQSEVPIQKAKTVKKIEKSIKKEKQDLEERKGLMREDPTKSSPETKEKLKNFNLLY